MELTSTEKPSRLPSWAKKVLPIFVSALILYYYFYNQDWEKLKESCIQANLWVATLAIVIPQVAFWFFSSLIVERTMRWFHGPFPLWKFFWVRGSIYILMFINTYIGEGGLLLYQQREGRITWRKLMGIWLFRTGLIFWGIGFLMIPATLAMHYYGLADKAKINMYVWWGILLIPGIWFFIGTWLFWFYKIDYTGLGKVIVRNRDSEFWTAFRVATPGQWFLIWAMILPPFVSTIVGFYFLNLAFDVNVPFVEFMVVGPLATLVMDLPIAFAGFGTTTLAWMIFFGDYGLPVDIAALTLFLPFARSGCRALIGLVSLRPALKDIGTLFRAEGVEAEKAAVTMEVDGGSIKQ